MMKTRVFKNGNSQAVRIPKELHFDVDELEIFQRGDELVLRKSVQNADVLFDLLTQFSDDFMKDGRQQGPPQERVAFREWPEDKLEEESR